MTPARSEVWWCETADAGRRPCVVLTRDVAIPRLGRVLVALATTKMRGLPSEVLLEPGDDPVPQRCVLNLDVPEVVPLSLLTQRLGRLSDERMRQVCRAMSIAVDCR